MEKHKYIIVKAPESQLLYSIKGFLENCYLITHGPLYEKYGDCAYFVDDEWYFNYLETTKIKV